MSSMSGSIARRVDCAGPTRAIEVHDTPPGILERFCRARFQGPRGTALGLPIAKRRLNEDALLSRAPARGAGLPLFCLRERRRLPLWALYRRGRQARTEFPDPPDFDYGIFISWVRLTNGIFMRVGLRLGVRQPRRGVKRWPISIRGYNRNSQRLRVPIHFSAWPMLPLQCAMLLRLQ
ncbi:hypothetical protein MPL3365_140064 [Mesorhizobium plurifarium]|uniref:Uncharacterized protein n=1 Tax=Mesorhizobium plurifarium TaxID=69974 RepID=A0A090G450_MESPL|nr:hypothetical protein MPL3365_140064 [Mesorhizobium plurifarium]